MITIDVNQVRLQAKASNKQDAIRQVGQLLVDSGCINVGYVASMLGREKVANTYLGNGIAISHGLPKDRHLIKRTAIAVVQIPTGVTWNRGETVHLVVGIAAASNEYGEVLKRLTRVLGNEEQVNRLTQATDSCEIIEALTGESLAPQRQSASSAAVDYPHVFDAVVQNKTGLHARPATNFVELAKGFQSAIRVRHGDSVADGKSLISLLQLGIERGATFHVSAQGPDAVAALDALQVAVAGGLGDEEEQPAPVAVREGPTWVPQEASVSIAGISASGGLAIGPLRQHVQQIIVVSDRSSDPAAEEERLQYALHAAQAELDELHEEVKTRLGPAKATIFRVHGELLNDAALIEQTMTLIFQRHSAAWAWQQVINESVGQLQKLADPVLAGRAIDLGDVGRRVLRHMVGAVEERPVVPDTPVILVAPDLTPSDTAVLTAGTILGLCTARGGPTSHTAILARALGIPAIVGAGDEVLDIPCDTFGILNGENGTLYLNISEADVQAARDVQQQLHVRHES